MTAEQLRERVLELIKEWFKNPDVQKSDTARQVLLCLSGDIMVINLKPGG